MDRRFISKKAVKQAVKKGYIRKTPLHPDHIAILDRVEMVRNTIDISKSAFCKKFDMVPQTYNNFIGKQSSKPNIELIIGIVNEWGVNPFWLLNGEGEMFDCVPLQVEEAFRSLAG